MAVPLFAALVVFPSVSQAKPTIELDLNPSEVAVGESAVLTITITDANGGSFTPPSFGDLLVQGPQTTQQSVMMLGGGGPSVRSSTVYQWAVEAPREGTFRIGGAKLVYHSETYMSESATLRCSGKAPPRAPPPVARSPFGNMFPDDPFDALDRMNQMGDPVRRRAGEDDVFLRAIVDKQEATVGEQVTLSLYLFSAPDVSGVSAVSFPKLDGFWAEEIEAPSQLSGEMRMIKGVPYHVYLLRRRALFPLRAGELTVDPVEAQVTLDIGIFPGSRGEVLKRKSAPLKINVKPLPTEGQPLAFDSANVGQFTINATASPTTVPLGQPVQLKVTLEGAGNVKGIRIPKPKLPEGLKTYDPTVTDAVRKGSSKYGGSKTVEWVIIPERTGPFTLPSIEFPYFDPEKGTYQTTHTPEIAIQVTGPASAPVPNSGQVAAPVATNVLSGGLRPIRLQGSLTAAVKPIWQERFIWPVTVLPVVLFGFVWGGMGFSALWRKRDPDQIRRRQAHSAASRRLKAAKDCLDANDSQGFYAEVTRSLQQFVTDKSNVAALGLTRDELGRALTERGYPVADVQTLVTLLETCENARFFPGAMSPEKMSAVLEQARQVLDVLESARLPTRAA
jgi:hypothetical protein